MDVQVPPHFHKEDRISEIDLIPDGSIYAALPVTGPEGARATIWDGSTATFYKMVKGAWRQVGGAGSSPAGSTGQIQFNLGGAFGADSGLTWDNVGKGLVIGSIGGYLNVDGLALYTNHGTGTSYIASSAYNLGFANGGGGILFDNSVYVRGSQAEYFYDYNGGLDGYFIGVPGRFYIGTGSANTTIIILEAAAQAVNILEVRDSTASNVLLAIDPLGALQPASIADASASNNSIYYSTTQSKLVYKNSGGTVNNLY